MDDDDDDDDTGQWKWMWKRVFPDFGDYREGNGAGGHLMQQQQQHSRGVYEFG